MVRYSYEWVSNLSDSSRGMFDGAIQKILMGVMCDDASLLGHRVADT